MLVKRTEHTFFYIFTYTFFARIFVMLTRFFVPTEDALVNCLVQYDKEFWFHNLGNGECGDLRGDLRGTCSVKYILTDHYLQTRGIRWG